EVRTLRESPEMRDAQQLEAARREAAEKEVLAGQREVDRQQAVRQADRARAEAEQAQGRVERERGLAAEAASAAEPLARRLALPWDRLGDVLAGPVDRSKQRMDQALEGRRE